MILVLICHRPHRNALELYAAVSLSRLWIERGRALEVPSLLQPIIAWFGEDSDDSELRQARKLVAIYC